MNISNAIQRVTQFTGAQQGVFRISDLANLLPSSFSRLALMRTIDKLVEAGTLARVQRGIYVTPQFNSWVLAQNMAPKSYVSMDTVLAKNGLIGTVPTRSLSIVDTRRGRTITTPQGIIRSFAIQPSLRFGYQYNKYGVAVADSEKAFLDLLYFYTKGHRFVIDPRNEVDISKLNRKTLTTYLKRYKNPKFVQFVKGLLNEKR
jgi:predicted transcriptional regulator of viral defense system